MSRVLEQVKIMSECDYSQCHGNSTRDVILRAIEGAAVLDEKELFGGSLIDEPPATLKKLEQMNCECENWARDGRPPMLSHHPKCSNYKPVGELMDIIKALIRGIECWASDEDGVHNECYDAYNKAKVSMGQYDHITNALDSNAIKGSANFNINQQTHGGQSVSQPAPNCLTATSPCC